jgi:acyl carrier protein
MAPLLVCVCVNEGIFRAPWSNIDDAERATVAFMATFEEITAATTSILARHLRAERPIVLSDHVQSDLGLDSLAVMEVIADIEEHFNVGFPNETLNELETVEDVVRALQRLLP